MITLVLGGARSGKSRYGERLGDEWRRGDARRTSHYIATCQALDDEMKARIIAHKNNRGPLWITHEEPFYLAPLIARLASKDSFILIDCLTLWLTNHLLAEAALDEQIEALCDVARKATGSLVFVANEVGLGIVPENKLARAFRDHAGLCNQTIASIADKVVFIAAGLPVTLKDASE